MLARARLSVELDTVRGRAVSRVSALRSEPPFVMRPAPVETAPWLPGWVLDDRAVACVHLVGAAAGPVGGDDLSLDVHVGPDAGLVLHQVAASLLLPGPDGRPSRSQVTVHVAAGGVFAWLPGPLIAAKGCSHDAVTRVVLEPGARLLLREELLLGRHGEGPGRVTQRIRVTSADEPLLDQTLDVDPAGPAGTSPAVLGGRRAVGSLLVAGSGWPDPATISAPACGPASEPDLAVMRLAGPGVLVSALAHDALTLRERLTDVAAAIALPGTAVVPTVA